MTSNAAAPVAASPLPTLLDEQSELRRRRRKVIVLLVLLAALLVVLLLFGWYLIFRQPINPLPLPSAFKPPSYSTSIYRSTSPIGVAVSPDGSRIYAADSNGDRALAVFDSSGKKLATARPPVETTGSEHVPIWVAIDPITSDVYVSDRPTGQVYVFSKDGVYQRTFNLLQPVRAWQPTGLAFDAAGNLYVADMGGDAVRIEVVDRVGAIVQTFGQADGLSFVNGLAVARNNIVYVADSNNGRILAYKDGQLIGSVGRGAGENKLALPRGLAVDDTGRLYVGDSTAMLVGVFAPVDPGNGRFVYLGDFGGPGNGDGKFVFPNGVATDMRGRIYVADTDNSRIQVWSY